jgi:broad specificity phosphatase PhoE
MAVTADTGHGPGDPRIVLVRHGETEWSRSGQHTGRTDIPLTPTGEYKAELAGGLLRGPFGLVLTSPLGRARETARLAGYGDAQHDDDLMEWDYGGYEGLTSAQIRERLGHGWTIWRDGAPAGDTPGEHADAVQRRAERVLERCRPHLDAGEQVLLFSHGHFLRALAGTWLGLGAVGGELLALDTSAVGSLGFEHGRRCLVTWNRVPGR